MHNIFQNKQIMFSLSVLGILLFISIFAPFITSHDPYEINLQINERLQSPSRAHLFGTDHLGRDLFSRVLYGARISLSIGLVAVVIMLVLGIVIGALSGYYGGLTDIILMRATEVIMCFPTIFLILIILAFVGPSIFNVMLVIGLTSWPSTARLVRAEILSLKERNFIKASKLLCVKDHQIILKHMLPNAIAPIVVNAIFSVGGAILAESALSFLGLGVQIPVPSWGNILLDGQSYMDSSWWIMLFPGTFILITVMSYNLLGEGLRSLWDVKRR